MSAPKTHVVRFAPRAVMVICGLEFKERNLARTICGRDVTDDATRPRTEAACKVCTRETVRMRRARLAAT